ncbi:MAG: mevalonate kinase [Oligoflexales bacterium]|nr:mevalonate kinase [Oligoflexales bacterium]
MPSRTKKSTPSNVLARSFACAKVIIAGEHAVVYGAPAIAAPVFSMEIQLTFTRLERLTSLRLPGARPTLLGGKEDTDEEEVRDQVDRVAQWSPETIQELKEEAYQVLRKFILEKNDREMRPWKEVESLLFHLSGTSNLLPGAGLGASASLSVSLIRGLSSVFGYVLTADEIAQLANQLERRFHGNPSGLDAAVISQRQTIFFQKGFGPTPLQVSPLLHENLILSEWPFALIDTGTRSSTLQMVEKAAPYFAPKGEVDQGLLRAFRTAVEAVRMGLESGQAQFVKDGMESCSQLLAHVGVVSPQLHESLAEAQDCGTVACKPTGAGGGGCLLALLPPTKAELCLSRLRSKFGRDRVYTMNLPSTKGANCQFVPNPHFTQNREQESYAIF